MTRVGDWVRPPATRGPHGLNRPSPCHFNSPSAYSHSCEQLQILILHGPKILLNYLPRILEASGMLQQANALHRVPVDELDNPNTVQAATSAVAEIEGESSRCRTPELNQTLQETIPIIERTIQPEHDIQTAEDAVDAIQIIRRLKLNHDPRELFTFDPEERLVELLSSTLGIATGIHPEQSPDPYR